MIDWENLTNREIADRVLESYEKHGWLSRSPEKERLVRRWAEDVIPFARNLHFILAGRVAIDFDGTDPQFREVTPPETA